MTEKEKEFAEELKIASRGYQLQEISNATGIDKSNISKILNGQMSPTLGSLLKIVDSIDAKLSITKIKKISKKMRKEIEKYVLGSFIVFSDKMEDEQFESLSKCVFEDARHAIMAKVLVHMHNVGAVIDMLTLADTLDLLDKFDEAGGAKYINAVAEAAVTPAKVDYNMSLLK